MAANPLTGNFNSSAKFGVGCMSHLVHIKQALSLPVQEIVQQYEKAGTQSLFPTALTTSFWTPTAEAKKTARVTSPHKAVEEQLQFMYWTDHVYISQSKPFITALFYPINYYSLQSLILSKFSKIQMIFFSSIPLSNLGIVLYCMHFNLWVANR